MKGKSLKYKREVLNQLINFFWTILCFAPILWFWIIDGVNLYLYLFIAIALLIGILPNNILNLFMISQDRNFYERLGVKQIRKFVQNGDAVKTINNKQDHFIINGFSQAKQYLKTIAMYERFHWVCFTFFLLTAMRCFTNGHLKLGLAITIANILYNFCAIILQQYNRIRIQKLLHLNNRKLTQEG